MSGKIFALLDRDGTIIKECHYLSDPAQVELLTGAAEGLRALMAMGIGLIVVTNQSAIGRGFFDVNRLQQIHARMCELLTAAGVSLNAIYFCPHTPVDDCLCRKPRTGLIDIAAKEWDFVTQTSFVIGDKPCDIELGQKVGATTFLVRSGYGVKVELEGNCSPDYIVDDLSAVAQVIKCQLETGKRRGEYAARD